MIIRKIWGYLPGNLSTEKLQQAEPLFAFECCRAHRLRAAAPAGARSTGYLARMPVGCS